MELAAENFLVKYKTILGVLVVIENNKYIKLAKHAMAFPYKKDTWVYGLGSQQTLFNDYHQWKIIVIISSVLTEKLYKKYELIQEVLDRYASVNEEDVMAAISFLEKNNFLMESEEFLPDERYSRNNIFYRLAGAEPRATLDRLSKKTVALIGCGGIGNYVAHMLALSGIKTLILVDADTVELSNLNRQFLFSEEDIGEYKIDILEKELKRRNHLVEIKKYYLQIENEKSYELIKESVDLLALSADFPSELLYWTNSFCVKKEVPFINVGYYNDISMFGPFVIPGKTSCIECMQPESNMDTENELINELDKIRKYYKPASFPTINAIASSLAINDIMKFLGGYGRIVSTNKRIGVHTLEPKIEEQVFSRRKDCSVCGHL